MTTPRHAFLLFIGLFVGTISSAYAQSGWIPTGPMTVGRYAQTATLLPNGKVLVVGGGDGLSSAELYDPNLGTWAATGSLTTGRDLHTAVLLPNGKVLVAGGFPVNGGGFLASAELYEPASGTWTTTGSLAVGRYKHTATLLPNGKVLVAGGFTTGSSSSAEIYDPTLGTWAPASSMATGRAAHTATNLPNGKVLVAGGYLFFTAQSSAEIYDPTSGNWTATGSLLNPRAYHAATLLPNGRVLVEGSGGVPGSSAELYDPTAGTWTATGSLATARFAHTATLLPSGRVLVAGGTANYSLSSAELYDPAAGTWAATGAMAVLRSQSTATLLGSGSVLVAGGENSSPSGTTLNTSAELYALLPVADLTITKTDGQATASPGQTITYTITGTNAGPTAAIGATVADTVPVALTGATWTCLAAGGATCTAGPSSGNISDTVNLPSAGTVTYTLTGQVSATAKSLSNTATITVPAQLFDPNLADNTATDTDLLVCNNDAVVVADGRLTAATIGAGATQWFGASLRIGDSYSLELTNAQVDTPVSGVPPGALTLYSGDDGCSGVSTLVATDTTGVDPAGSGSSVRMSFTASGTSPFFRAKLVSGSPNPILYAVTWSDTTMYSPAWSTNGSFDTYYSVENTTGTALTAVLMLFDPSGTVSGTSTLTIPAGDKVSTNTQALGITRNRTGTARLTHNGPPGALTVQASIANFTLATPYAQAVRFETVREVR
jgi:uncharacterized repeat protein (TIGR01451 family)